MTREEAIAIFKGFKFLPREMKAVDMAIKALEQAEPEKCGDCISRQAAKLKVARVTWEDGDSHYDFHDKCVDCLDDLPPVEPKKCGDCISREETKQFLYERLDRLNDDELYDIFSRIIDDMYNELPSVTPQPKIGRWMECGGDEPWLKGYCCSLCNFTTTQKYDYCTCGAKMADSQESEDKE